MFSMTGTWTTRVLWYGTGSCLSLCFGVLWQRKGSAAALLPSGGKSAGCPLGLHDTELGEPRGAAGQSWECDSPVGPIDSSGLAMSGLLPTWPPLTP